MNPKVFTGTVVPGLEHLVDRAHAFYICVEQE